MRRVLHMSINKKKTTKSCDIFLCGDLILRSKQLVDSSVLLPLSPPNVDPKAQRKH